MAITKDDVFQAIKELISQNMNPSTRKIREKLQTGSMDTIRKYVKMYKEEKAKENDEKNEPQKTGNEKEYEKLLEENARLKTLLEERNVKIAVISRELELLKKEKDEIESNVIKIENICKEINKILKK